MTYKEAILVNAKIINRFLSETEGSHPVEIVEAKMAVAQVHATSNLIPALMSIQETLEDLVSAVKGASEKPCPLCAQVTRES